MPPLLRDAGWDADRSGGEDRGRATLRFNAEMKTSAGQVEAEGLGRDSVSGPAGIVLSQDGAVG